MCTIKKIIVLIVVLLMLMISSWAAESKVPDTPLEYENFAGGEMLKGIGNGDLAKVKRGV